jgi:PKHD-type hydroxylase
MFTVPNLLTPSDLQQVQRLIPSGKFINGRVTNDSQDKNNLELEVGEVYLKVVDIINRAIEASEKIIYRMLPRYRTNPIVNRYDVGMQYKEHIDIPIQGFQTQVGKSPGRYGSQFTRTDYSMTLFLSDPLSYEGGELEIRILEDSSKVKLPAGSAVVYTTGIPHRVLPVTRGSRLAAVCWFQSAIRDVNLRRILWDQHCLSERLLQAGQVPFSEDANDIKYNLIRYLAEI